MENFEEGQDIHMVLQCFSIKCPKLTSLMGNRWILCVSRQDTPEMIENHLSWFLLRNHDFNPIMRRDKTQSEESSILQRGNLFFKIASVIRRQRKAEEMFPGWRRLKRHDN